MQDTCSVGGFLPCLFGVVLDRMKAALAVADYHRPAGVADHLLAVPSTVVSRIQEVHALCLHIVAEALEAAAARTGAGA